MAREDYTGAQVMLTAEQDAQLSDYVDYINAIREHESEGKPYKRYKKADALRDGLRLLLGEAGFEFSAPPSRGGWRQG